MANIVVSLPISAGTLLVVGLLVSLASSGLKVGRSFAKLDGHLFSGQLFTDRHPGDVDSESKRAKERERKRETERDRERQKEKEKDRE